MTLPKLSLVSSPGKSDAVALGWFQDEGSSSEKNQKAKPAAPRYVGRRQKEIDALAAQLKSGHHFAGKKFETAVLRFFTLHGAPNVILLGLGKTSKFNPEIARQAGAALFLAQKKEKLAKLSLVADGVFGEVAGKEGAYYLQAFCEGYLLAGYEYRDLKKETPETVVPELLEIVQGKAEGAAEALTRATLLARAVNFARSLGDKPGNVLTPSEFARLVEKMAKERSMKTTVLGRSALDKEKMGLFVGVAKGSIEEPKLIVVEHRGGKKTDRPIALVGKGITFDSGGISIKPSANMEDMKYDMMGAAAVAGIMQAVGDLDLPVNVVGVIATCENMPGGRAQKPGDVMRSMTGKTVEIVNTDAEGRLILADALEYTQKTQNPQAIIDFATLTGAVVVALGSVTTGIMGTSPALVQQIKDAADVTGERVWELPLYEEYEEDLKSAYADIRNSGTREAGASKGGTFLKHFVESKYPWVHCDIAGAAYHRKDVNYHPSKYAAGVMVRLIAHLLENWSPVK